MKSCIAPLFVPGHKPERYAKAAASGADAIIIDLEDAVPPASKGLARDALCRPNALPVAIDVYVRVNAADTPWHQEDMAALANLSLAGVMLAKSESLCDIERLSKVSMGKPVVALIETALGLSRAREIAAAAGVRRLAFGSIDYCVDIGAAHLREMLLAARSEIVLASRLASLPAPLDGVTASFDDDALLEEDTRYALNLGFGGKLCIHPRQIAPVWKGFMPTPEELAWAQKIAAAGEHGAVSVDGAMVDAPVRARAKYILQRVQYKNNSPLEETS